MTNGGTLFQLLETSLGYKLSAFLFRVEIISEIRKVWRYGKLEIMDCVKGIMAREMWEATKSKGKGGEGDSKESFDDVS